jgi:calcineurin-binding protein cabin-1
MLEPYRDVVGENVEQMTYCLYGYPTKKARSRHIEEHDAEHIELNWDRAIQLFDIFRPDTLPEFDSFKLASITSDMEQLLLRILPLIPKTMDVLPLTTPIKNFINGSETGLPKETNLLPQRIASIYYLLADFYFKSQETQKAIKYYIYDLSIKPEHFDSWAGLALSKASKLETKLNSFGSISVKEFMEQADNTSRCFQQCLKLKNTNTIWAEFGSFSYNLQSFCSKSLKQCSDTLSMESFAAIEQHKERYLQLSLKCFSTVNNSEDAGKKGVNESSSNDDNHDEKWYYHFMLGKIAEKQKEHPNVYLDHYLKVSFCFK